ncbi:hypothetical protein AG1IA_09941 [Rhizoctonia solani AG-1 IA]|uniref:Uncharacterized protein n=1 Tax=Thanatephorus cucumeris (strain AG1-IA) TaxID=983506 RepID=L8WI26_THACA|nr:hypothetical protein AG1IA_09941 [Rhizoctonia solani AG-1 IA]
MAYYSFLFYHSTGPVRDNQYTQAWLCETHTHKQRHASPRGPIIGRYSARSWSSQYALVQLWRHESHPNGLTVSLLEVTNVRTRYSTFSKPQSSLGQKWTNVAVHRVSMQNRVKPYKFEAPCNVFVGVKRHAPRSLAVVVA